MIKIILKKIISIALLSVLVTSQSAFANWNNPYSDKEKEESVLYSSFSARPKHLDPIRAYGEDEFIFIRQIYESPLQYHFLKRPFELEPRLLTQMPTLILRDQDGNIVNGDDPTQVAYSEYRLNLKPGIKYQPHPALAKNENDEYRYHDLTYEQATAYKKLNQFEYTGTRELVASDLLYQIKRFAHPSLHSPLNGLMQEKIEGMSELSNKLQAILKDNPKATINLREHPLAGVTVDNDYQLTIRLKEAYPQFIYWLGMPFFSPMPWEAEVFYGQEGMQENNLNLNWYPIGTGPYMLTENNPNLQMVLDRNPNFRLETYPTEGAPGDKERGLLIDAGKPLPFIDKVIYSLEKEAIPLWTKFLQGYYDRSGISSSSFDQVISYAGADINLSETMVDKGITLDTETETVTYYMGFNMLDDVVGGDSDRARLLRQAISIAMDNEEYIEVFLNGRGQTAHNFIPPGIFGHVEGQAGINAYIFDWVDGQAKRKSIEVAKALLAKADYANGIDQRTNKPLTLYYDNVDRGPSDKPLLNWKRKQFEKLGIQLVVRNTDYNRFQEKMNNGKAQMFSWGWGADYPDPENFMFLFYSKNGKVEHGGPNYTNFNNSEFDRLFDQMRNMPNTPERLALVEKMTEVIRHEANVVLSFYPKLYVLSHEWYKNGKLNMITDGTLKYRRVDPQVRASKREAWNKPKLWPLLLIALLIAAILIPAYQAYRRSEQKSGLRKSSTD